MPRPRRSVSGWSLGWVLCAVLAAAWVGGHGRDCRASTHMPPPHTPTIELLGFRGCPNTPMLRANLSAALASLGGGWTFTEIDQERLDQADARRGYPTPTILINGHDLYGLPAPHEPAGASLRCRVYQRGVPTADDLTAKLAASMS